MAFESICEHPSSAFIITQAAMNLSCEQRALYEIQMASKEHFVNFFASRYLSLIKRNFCFGPIGQ